MREKRKYDEKAFFEKLTEFENRWAAEEQQITYRHPSDHMKLSSDFITKYGF
jgi:hypothetical protein